jgi:hypothetical protein
LWLLVAGHKLVLLWLLTVGWLTTIVAATAVVVSIYIGVN